MKRIPTKEEDSLYLFFQAIAFAEEARLYASGQIDDITHERLYTKLYEQVDLALRQYLSHFDPSQHVRIVQGIKDDIESLIVKGTITPRKDQ